MSKVGQPANAALPLLSLLSMLLLSKGQAFLDCPWGLCALMHLVWFSSLHAGVDFHLVLV